MITFEVNLPHMKENHFNKNLAKIIDLSIQSTEKWDSSTSLKELYERKKGNMNLSDRQIQKMLGIQKKALDAILDGEAKQINFINIIKLAHFLGLSINDITKIYVPEMSAEQIGEIERARVAGYITEFFDVETLSKMRFLKRDASAHDISEKLKTFFALDTIYNYSDNISNTAFSRTKKDSNDLMRFFWVRSALTQFEIIANPYEYDRYGLIKLMPRIRPFTRDEEFGLIKVAKALYAVGITVIFQPTVEKLQVRGATMSVNGKPCIVLSNLNNRYPTLWFALLHELYHVLYDFEDIADMVYHITEDVQKNLFLMNEEKADDFAQQYLLSDTRYKFVRGYISSKLQVAKVAKEWGVHPSVVYSRHCYETNEWAFYSKHIPKMDKALKLLNTHPFEQESLVESANKIKEIISI